jgi:DNA repair protein SbcC/Rad50
MIPHKLVLRGFLSYRHPVELDFTGFTLACISGPNGAGKSSLLDAITWALFGQARKRDDSVIHTHPEITAAEVAFTFEYEGGLYRVQRTAPRGKTTLLEFHVQQPAAEGGAAPEWKALTERTQRETQARIENILRMDYETFINASFFVQDKADQFTQQRPGDRKRILGSILGLEIWEVYRARAAEQRRGVESQVSEIQGRLGEIEAELGEEHARAERLASLQAELKTAAAARQDQEAALDSFRKTAATLQEQRRLVDALARQLDSANRRLSEIQSRLLARQAEKQSYTDLVQRAGQIQADYQSWQEARQALQELESLAARHLQLERQRQEPEAEIAAARARLEQECASLQVRHQEALTCQARLPELESQLIVQQQTLAQAEAELERKNELEVELNQVRQDKPRLEAENKRLAVEMEEIKAHIEQLSQDGDGLCPFCGQPLSPADRERLVESLQAQGKEKGDHYRANKAQFDQAAQIERSLFQQIQSRSNAQALVLAHSRAMDQIAAQQGQVEERLAVWDNTESIRLAEVERQLAQGDFCSEARQRLAALEQERTALGYDEAAHNALRHQETAGRQAELDLRELEKAQGVLSTVERDLVDLQEQNAVSQAESDALDVEYRSAAEIVSQAEKRSPDIEAAERQLDVWRERENQLRMEVGAAQQKVAILDELRKRRTMLQAEIEALSVQIGRYKQLERSFGRDGVPALLIEQALPEIEARANLILDRLSSGGMTVRFVTQAAFKDKKREDLRETLDIQISDGSGVRDYEMYSGGEAFRVNFAIRLALSEVLAQRAGARLQMLVIDEGFGSQDSQGRQRLVEAINLVKDDFAKILVITHIEELKDAFPNRIEVEKTDQGSRISLI